MDIRATRAYQLESLTYAVQYRGRQSHISPTTWLTMAAFDCMTAAEAYLDRQKENEYYKYQMIELPQEQ